MNIVISEFSSDSMHYESYTHFHGSQKDYVVLPFQSDNNAERKNFAARVCEYEFPGFDVFAGGLEAEILADDGFAEDCAEAVGIEVQHHKTIHRGEY